MEKVIDVMVLHLDKWGLPTEKKEDVDDFRISIFCDYDSNNHHIQFKKGADRMEVGKRLHEMANRVLHMQVPEEETKQ